MKILTNCVRFVLLLFLIECTSSDKLISILLQKCYGTCNKTFCNMSYRCRPLNRTSKMVSMDFYFNQEVTLEAPINIEIIAYKKFRTEYRQHMFKGKTELCAQLISMDHPYFGLFRNYLSQLKGNLFDPCPLSGHRYLNPYVSSHSYFPLVPVGEWKMDHILSKNINNAVVVIASWSDFYEIKPTGAEEF